MRDCLAITRNDLRILRHDLAPVLLLFLMPLLVMAFLKPALQPALRAEGVANANGAEQAVPGMTVLFAIFLVSNVGFVFFREHGWGTWDRLRSSGISTISIMVGKTIAPLMIQLLQITLLFTVGGIVYDLHIRGSIPALALVILAFSCTLVALGLVLVGLCKTVAQLNAFTYLGALLFAGLGGAITPLPSLPGWARAIAPATPSYWAMRGFRSVILFGGGLGDVLRPLLILGAFLSVLALIAFRRLRFSEAKISWA